ncbi:EGF-containing fibulin-like extracellular matrix protein 1 [Montipora capricornis]|uniref:EGF-containing fibulin-like extracellular matrix protein 1 n=1 Tax=Montipora capricornis TaxID=246305 RepID=UPI0035F16DA9
MDGDYTCHCEYGFHFNKEKQACEDIDECVTRDFACADQANCVNNEGDFECVCPEGYEGNGKDYCSANTSASIKKEINWTVFVTMATTSLIIILLKSNEF